MPTVIIANSPQHGDGDELSLPVAERRLLDLWMEQHRPSYEEMPARLIDI